MRHFFASLAPLIIVGALALLLWLFGLGNLIPVFAEVWDGLLFPLVLLGGLAMAVALFGMIGWPMIHATLSAEGSDSFDALSRSYSYVYRSWGKRSPRSSWFLLLPLRSHQSSSRPSTGAEAVSSGRSELLDSSLSAAH